MRTRCEAAESEIDSESTRLRALMLAEVGRAVALRKFFCISSLMSRARARLARPSITQNLSASPRAPPAARPRARAAVYFLWQARGAGGEQLELLALLHHPRETNVHV